MEENVIKLIKEEIGVLKTYQQNIDDAKAALGALRQSYLVSERKAIENINKANADFLSHIKVLASSKELPAEEDWFFDPATYTFRKKEIS